VAVEVSGLRGPIPMPPGRTVKVELPVPRPMCVPKIRRAAATASGPSARMTVVVAGLSP
jgi:hypothetical protein